jgi:hypothetical protein
MCEVTLVLGATGRRGRAARPAVSIVTLALALAACTNGSGHPAAPSSDGGSGGTAGAGGGAGAGAGGDPGTCAAMAGTDGGVAAASAIADGAWQAAALVDTGAYSPTVATDAAGNLIVAWPQADHVAGTMSVRARRFDAALGSWGEIATVSDPILHGDVVASVDLAVAGNGDAIVTWRQGNPEQGTADRLWSNHYTLAWGWEAPVMIALGWNELDHGIAMAPDGEGMFTYSGAGAEGPGLQAMRYLPGSGWQPATNVSGAQTVADWKVALDGRGRALLVVAVQGDAVFPNMAYTIWANRFEPASGWTAPERIDGTLGVSQAPMLAMSACGDAVALWAEGPGGESDIYANRFSAAAGWQEPTLVRSNAAPSWVAMGAGGDAIVVWIENGGAWAARMDPTSGWGTPTQLRGGNAASPAVAIDPNGYAVAAWTDEPSAGADLWDLWVDRFVPGAGWQGPSLLEGASATEGDSFPVLGVDAGGRATAAWVRGSLTTSAVWTARLQ